MATSVIASLVPLSRPRRTVQMYWARRNNHYRRLGSGGSPSRHLKVARLGGGAGPGAPRRTRAPGAAVRRLRWVATMLLSPARVLARLRDAYVDAMLALAAARTCAAMARPRVGAAAGAEYQTASALWAKRVPRARTERHGSASSASEFERRMMAHIYNALVTPEVAMA